LRFPADVPAIELAVTSHQLITSLLSKKQMAEVEHLQSTSVEIFSKRPHSALPRVMALFQEAAKLKCDRFSRRRHGGGNATVAV